MKKSGFSLIEVMVVLAIIGILAVIAIPNFGGFRERAFDDEATAVLRQMNSAQRFYDLKNAVFYLSTGGDPSQHIQNINGNLKLDLISGNNRNWDYFCYNDGCVQATRFGGNSRNWRMRIAEEDPVDAATCP